MPKTDTKNQEEIKRFLFYELSETEREDFEERFFDDDDFFYELIDLENELVDRYSIGKMSSTEKHRFENSLQKLPERREKIANSLVLQRLIKKERAVAANPTFGEKISSFFINPNSFVKLATAAMLFLLITGIALLILERSHISKELADLQSLQKQRETELETAENKLQEQIKQSEQRENVLQNELTDKNAQKDRLIEQIEREKNEKLKLVSDLENLRKEKNKIVPEKPKQVQSPKSIIATLLPYSGGKGGGGNDTKLIKLERNTNDIILNLQIPNESVSELFDVKLNGENLQNGRKPQNGRLTINLPTNKIDNSNQTITLVGNSETFRYIFRLKRQ